MHLLLIFPTPSLSPERLVERLRALGAPDPLFVRARSTAAMLSPEVPIFAGLRSLAVGADEDRLVALSLLNAGEEECRRISERLQLELKADNPPSGTAVALPVLAPVAKS